MTIESQEAVRELMEQIESAKEALKEFSREDFEHLSPVVETAAPAHPMRQLGLLAIGTRRGGNSTQCVMSASLSCARL